MLKLLLGRSGTGKTAALLRAVAAREGGGEQILLVPIRFLRAREIVHFQRFGEALRSVQEQLDSKNFYAFNPSFDAPVSCPPCGNGNAS